MKEVFIKDKKSNHRVRVAGKDIKFINGKAELSNDEAIVLKERNDPEYTVKDPELQLHEIPKAIPKPKPKTGRKK